ncbi:hypothetical protein HOL63_03605 [Candidatus Peregrinibacteria bacterium]|nr:hypothetical protein [Candidatus Peregrinibacteria bacterium]
MTSIIHLGDDFSNGDDRIDFDDHTIAGILDRDPRSAFDTLDVVTVDDFSSFVSRASNDLELGRFSICDLVLDERAEFCMSGSF